MKFVRLSAALALTFLVACGGGAGSEEEAGSGAGTTNGTPASKETNGAQLAVPGSNTTHPQSSAPQPAPAANGDEDSGEDTGTTPAAPAAPTAPAKPLYVPPECDADCIAHDVPGVIARASKKYNIPRWFYYAIIRRESTFDRCKTQPENALNKDWGRGLTQVTFPWYAGVPYPQHLSSVNNGDTAWRNNMGLGGSYGAWIDMNDVTAIASAPATESDCRNNPKANDAYDPKTNLDRFSTGFAAPAYHLFHVAGEAPEETLRKVAYHWHYGLWGSKSGGYPTDPRPYLTCATCYDTHVKTYKAAVEADDAAWVGPTCKPPYKDSGC